VTLRMKPVDSANENMCCMITPSPICCVRVLGLTWEYALILLIIVC